MRQKSEKIFGESLQFNEIHNEILFKRFEKPIKNTTIFGLKNIKNHRDWLRIKEKQAGNHCSSLICRSQINWNTLKKQSKTQGSLEQLDWKPKVRRRGMTADHRTYLEKQLKHSEINGLKSPELKNTLETNTKYNHQGYAIYVHTWINEFFQRGPDKEFRHIRSIIMFGVTGVMQLLAVILETLAW